MKWEHPREHQDLLKDSWSRWTQIVELFALRRSGRRRVDPQAYSDLRSRLMATCRALAESATDAERRAYYTALEETVRPWLNPNVIGRTDHEILSALLSRCHEVEQELTGRRRTVWRGPSRSLPVLFTFAGAVVFGLVWVLLEFGRPALEAAYDAVDTAWFNITRLSSFYLLSAIAIIIIAVAIYMASRTTRA
jgi:hypothetical protein